MYVAQYAKSLALVEVLLKAGADVNARNKVSAWEGDGKGCHAHIDIHAKGLLR